MPVLYNAYSDPTDNYQIVRSGGAADSMTDLRFHAGVKAGEWFAAGSLCSLTPELVVQPGLQYPTSMPLFATGSSHAADAGQFAGELVKDIEGQASGAGGQGVVNLLPCTGGYELSTTAWNNVDYTAGDYTPGSCVLMPDPVYLGQVTIAPADYSNYTVVGIVSIGVSTAREGVNRARLRNNQKALLHFWTHLQLPVNTTPESGS